MGQIRNWEVKERKLTSFDNQVERKKLIDEKARTQSERQLVYGDRIINQLWRHTQEPLTFVLMGRFRMSTTQIVLRHCAIWNDMKKPRKTLREVYL
jgi:hypothetical protein